MINAGPNAPINSGRIENDEEGMRAALQWSRHGRGWTSPRPSVGCVLVRNGRIISGAHTQPGDGNLHAETGALLAARLANEEPRGATCYVTLEPCCHWGTTPPCTTALIEAGIGRVVFGISDPNPAVSGRGDELLREAGIAVTSGVLWQECLRAQEDFLKFIAAQSPFVTLKSALSLDGKTALPDGESQWITGEAARRRAHQLRHEHDAVIVGIETVLRDDPQLNVRLEGEWKQPARVVLDTQGRIPETAKLWREVAQIPLYIAVGESLDEARQNQLEAAGAQVIRVPLQNNRLDLQVLCARLWERGLCSILIEGGATLAGAAMQAGIVDKIAFFLAPRLLGEGRPALSGFLLEKLSDSSRLRHLKVEQCDDDLLISGYLRPLCDEDN